MSRFGTQGRRYEARSISSEIDIDERPLDLDRRCSRDRSHRGVSDHPFGVGMHTLPSWEQGWGRSSPGHGPKRSRSRTKTSTRSSKSTGGRRGVRGYERSLGDKHPGLTSTSCFGIVGSSRSRDERLTPPAAPTRQANVHPPSPRSAGGTCARRTALNGRFASAEACGNPSEVLEERLEARTEGERERRGGGAGRNQHLLELGTAAKENGWTDVRACGSVRGDVNDEEKAA